MKRRLMIVCVLISIFLLGWQSTEKVYASETTKIGVATKYPASIKLSAYTFTYDGNVKRPGVNVYDQDGGLIGANNYTITYSGDCKSVGKYYVSIVCSGENYKGSIKTSYKIIPRGTKLAILTARVKGFQVTWYRQPVTADGYQLQYSPYSSFSSSVTKTYAGTDTKFATISGLSGHKYYYVRIRTCFTKDGVTYYSAWCQYKKVYTRIYTDNYTVVNSVESVAKTQYINTDKRLSEERRKGLANALSGLSGSVVSFVMIDLDTGEGLARNIDRLHFGASTIKGPYVCAINNAYPAKSLNYKTTMIATIEKSNNTAYKKLRSVFGATAFQKFVKEAHTSINTTYSWPNYTPRKLTCLWLRSWEYMESGQNNSTWVKSIFTNSLHSYIREQLKSTSVQVYTKSGWLGESGIRRCQHDAGVIKKSNGHTYMICILSTAYGNKPALRKLVAELDKIEEEFVTK